MSQLKRARSLSSHVILFQTVRLVAQNRTGVVRRLARSVRSRALCAFWFPVASAALYPTYLLESSGICENCGAKLSSGGELLRHFVVHRKRQAEIVVTALQFSVLLVVGEPSFRQPADANPSASGTWSTKLILSAAATSEFESFVKLNIRILMHSEENLLFLCCKRFVCK